MCILDVHVRVQLSFRSTQVWTSRIHMTANTQMD